MKILHLLSNWKWTERAEPSAELALAQQALGHDVVFACDIALEDDEDAVVFRARKKGLKDVRMLSLPKHFKLFSLRREVKELQKLIDQVAPRIVHAHMPHAGLVARQAAGRRKDLGLVQHCYDPCGPAVGFRDRLFSGRPVDGMVVICDEARTFAAKDTRVDEKKIIVVPPAVDTERFMPGSQRSVDRKIFGLSDGAFVVGVVSRIRKSRRLDIPIEAFAKLAHDVPQGRLLVVGRGSGEAVAEVVTDPANELGIAGQVILGGYCRDEMLVSAYRAMDVLVYPAPGTDKSCRTIREALTTGVPVIGVRTGFVPSLIDDGENGLLIEPTAENCEFALRELIANGDRLAGMREKARTSAEERFSPERMARAMDSFYNSILKEKDLA